MNRWIRNLLVFASLFGAQPIVAAPVSKWGELKTPPGSAVPDSRQGASAIYDPIRNVMVLYGGSKLVSRNGVQETEFKTDVWTESFGSKTEWVQRIASGGPPARTNQSTIYDSLRDRMVIFGGQVNGEILNDVWALSLETFTWSPVVTTGTGPDLRLFESVIYDEARDRMIIYAGSREVEGGLLTFTDVWALQFGDTNTWQRLEPSNAGPGRRSLHAAFYIPESDWMVVTGGYDYGAAKNDVWALTLGSNPEWIQLYPDNDGSEAPQGLWNAGCFDANRNEIVWFGTCCPYASSVWTFSLENRNWVDVTPKNAGPSPRGGVTQIVDPVLNRLVIFGGTDNYPNYFNETWSLKWRDPVSHGRPMLTPVENDARLTPVALEVFPNPVRAHSRIVYALSSAQKINLSVYDLQGRLVATLRDGIEESGQHEVAFPALRGQPAGIYFVRLLAQEREETRRILVAP